MALMNVEFFSQTLGLSSQMTVILPQELQGVGVSGMKRNGRYPVLWLLHGASDDHTVWLRRTSIERYVAPLGIAVVMPAVQLSMYANMVYGGKYFDYVSEELPEIVRGFFPVSAERKDNFIAGLSMGGYGALKIGLSKPENYAAIGCLSGGNAVYRYANKPGMPENMNIKLAFGVSDAKDLQGTEHDVFTLAENIIKSRRIIPKIFIATGTEDHGYNDTKFTYEQLQKRLNSCTYGEGPGTHNWEFWDLWIQKYLLWLTENGMIELNK